MGRTRERGSVDKTKERTQGTMGLFVKVQTQGTVVGRFVMLRIQDTGDGKCKSSIS